MANTSGCEVEWWPSIPAFVIEGGRGAEIEAPLGVAGLLPRQFLLSRQGVSSGARLRIDCVAVRLCACFHLTGNEIMVMAQFTNPKAISCMVFVCMRSGCFEGCLGARIAHLRTCHEDFGKIKTN